MTMSGDQNPVVTVTGRFMGFVSLGVSAGFSVGIGDDAWVTVNVVVATPPVEPVTVNVYTPGDTSGTWKIMFGTLYNRAVIIPTFIVPKVTFSTLETRKPKVTTVTIGPGGPLKGSNVTDRFSGLNIGIIIAAKVNILRKSSDSVALLKLLNISAKNSGKEIATLRSNVAFSQI